MTDWRFGDVVKTRDDRNLPLGRFMYIGPGEYLGSFVAICIHEDPEDPRPVGVRAIGGLYANWSRDAFEKVTVVR